MHLKIPCSSLDQSIWDTMRSECIEIGIEGKIHTVYVIQVHTHLMHVSYSLSMPQKNLETQKMSHLLRQRLLLCFWGIKAKMVAKCICGRESLSRVTCQMRIDIWTDVGPVLV